jgi:hypothetical protein
LSYEFLFAQQKMLLAGILSAIPINVPFMSAYAGGRIERWSPPGEGVMADPATQPKSRIRAMRLIIDKGACRYDRDRHLDRLLGGYAGVRSGATSDPALTIAKLKRALRSQRQLGRAGHWSYDLNRHFGLLQALKAELARSRAHSMAAAGSNAGAAAGISETGTETS